MLIQAFFYKHNNGGAFWVRAHFLGVPGTNIALLLFIRLSTVIEALIGKLEIPTVREAHEVLYVGQA